MNGDNEAEPTADRFFTLFAQRRTEIEVCHDPVDEPRLVDGTRPRGLVEQGLVRTTGWLQFGTRPVSSGLVAAVAALPIAVVIVVALLPTVHVIGGLLALLPALCYGGWRLLTVRLLPASTARNIGTVVVDDVEAGSWVRLCGSIGPVAQVASTCSGATTPVEVTFVGGACRNWPQGRLLHLVEVLD
jgi:hypothetical protein